ncbi:MAG: DUF3791 domain-containing protein [Endomicrobia bacterium]|nr:DUF3791 domain-containing protein [Endomicrobiia bacterium]
MTKEYAFLVYCIETYADAKNILSPDVLALFKKSGIYEYILNSYEALHVFGARELVTEFSEIIAEGGIKKQA